MRGLVDQSAHRPERQLCRGEVAHLRLTNSDPGGTFEMAIRLRTGRVAIGSDNAELELIPEPLDDAAYASDGSTGAEAWKVEARERQDTRLFGGLRPRYGAPTLLVNSTAVPA